VPPNVWFLVDDCEAEWVNGSGWDFAHLRQMTPTLTDVPRVVEQIFAYVRPSPAHRPPAATRLLTAPPGT